MDVSDNLFKSHNDKNPRKVDKLNKIPSEHDVGDEKIRKTHQVGFTEEFTAGNFNSATSKEEWKSHSIISCKDKEKEKSEKNTLYFIQGKNVDNQLGDLDNILINDFSCIKYIQIYVDKCDSEVYEISYLNIKRYVKVSELVRLSNDLNAYFTDLNINKTVDLISIEYYRLDLDSFSIEKVMNLLDNSNNKKKIELPVDLAFSKDGHYLLYTYSSLVEYAHYWRRSENLLPFLLKKLSQDLIEIPYGDDYKDYEYRYNKIAFHLNHGTLHGIRSSILLRAFYSMITKLRNIEKEEGLNLSEEEISCLELAAFLFRSGRTNELGWKDDITYSPRSAAIFKQIALELGYNPNLVVVIAEAFDFKKEIFFGSHIEGSHKLSYVKAKLYQTLFHLTHTCDLIRCFTDQEFLVSQVINDLRQLLCEKIDPVECANKMFEFAELLCKKTGAPTLYRSPKEYGNRVLAVIKTADVDTTFEELKKDRENFDFELFKQINQ